MYSGMGYAVDVPGKGMDGLMMMLMISHVARGGGVFYGVHHPVLA